MQLTDCFETLYHSNYPALLALVRNDPKHWTKTAFTWLGRVNIIKMNVLPLVLFYLQMVPVPLPSTFFSSITSMFSEFVWSAKRPRIAMRVLKRSKRAGG